MKKTAIILALAFSATTCLLVAQDDNQGPEGQPPARHQGGPGGMRGQGGLHLLPPRAAEQLKLTEDQQKQIAALEAEVKAKMEKILTAAQLKQLKEMRPPMRQGGQGGPGGPGGQGGPDRKGPAGEDAGAPQPPPGE